MKIKLGPILYALDNVYYRIGVPIGVGYQEAKKYDDGRPTIPAVDE